MAILKGLVKVLKKIFVGDKSSSAKNKTRRFRGIRIPRPSSKKKRSSRSVRRKPAARKRRDARIKTRKAKHKRPDRPRKSKISVPSSIKKKAVKLPTRQRSGANSRNDKEPELCVGEITHYFSKIMVVVVKVTGGSLRVGEKIHILGNATDFTQTISSMQVESVDVQAAHKGQLIGLKVKQIARVGDKVFKV